MLRLLGGVLFTALSRHGGAAVLRAKRALIRKCGNVRTWHEADMAGRAADGQSGHRVCAARGPFLTHCGRSAFCAVACGLPWIAIKSPLVPSGKTVVYEVPGHSVRRTLHVRQVIRPRRHCAAERRFSKKLR